MSSSVATNRFIHSSLRIGIYQQLTSNVLSLHELGRRLVSEAEIAKGFRHTTRLEDLGELLSNFPLKECRLIGQYYLAWCGYREGKDVRSDLERVIEQSTSYRGKALLSLAAVEAGTYDSELKLYREAAKWGDASIIAQAARGIAIVKSGEGSHRQAVSDLENIAGLIKFSDPISNFQYLNSLAVELGEVGRIGEAQNISNIVLASPYAFAYPEWRETGREIAFRGYKSRSVVSVGQTISRSLLYLPEREASDTPTQSGPAPVLSYLEWKKNMVKEPNDELPPNASEKDLYLKIMEMMAQRDLSVSELRQVIAFIEKLTSKQD